MGIIRLHTEQNKEVTCISNIFIDSYMPSANGSFVKIYLYLLRCLQHPQKDLSISNISDHFDCTESDVIRALKYWEKVNLLSITRDAGGQITDIELNEPEKEEKPEMLSTPKPSPHTTQMVSKPILTGTPTHSGVPANSGNPNYNAGITQESPYARKDYSEVELRSLQKDSTFETILKIVQGYLERPLSPQDIQLVAFLYKDLQFSDDLIYHLFEYCINRGKRRTNYIEKVAISWAQANVKTPEDADTASAEYNADYSAVCKAFGLNRMPGAVEQQYINRWAKEFGFDRDIIVEACNRTLLKIQRPDFKYANKILKSWHESGVKKYADIAAQDAMHQTKQSTTPKNSAPNNNKFNAFPQRNYSKEDFSSLEKRLLEKSMNQK